MVWCDAGLPGIDPLAPDQAARSHREVGTFKNDGGALAPQLQRHRREVCSGPLQHLPADAAATGEKDVVEGHGHQLGRDGSISLDHLHHLRLEVLRDQPCDQIRDGTGVFRRLEHGGVASSQGTDQGPQRQLKGIVPRSDHQNAPEWFRYNLGLAGAE